MHTKLILKYNRDLRSFDFKSNIGTDFFSFDFFFSKKSKILMHLGIYALFEFNHNPSAESDVSSTLQIRMCKRRKKRERFLVLKV